MNPQPVVDAPITGDVATAEAARELTDRIKQCVEQAWELIKQAYSTRVWIPLGYRSWDDYCATEFDRARICIPREERTEVVASLRDIGMSTRAIAAATGISKSTVADELSGVRNWTPEVTGLDGKTYQPKPTDSGPVATADGTASAPSRRRAPITESFDAARRDLVKDTQRLARLVEDNRFDRHAAHLAHQHLADLTRARDALQAVIDHLPDPVEGGDQTPDRGLHQ